MIRPEDGKIKGINPCNSKAIHRHTNSHVKILLFSVNTRGWSDKKKLSEFRHEEARFIIAFDQNSPIPTTTTPPQQTSDSLSAAAAVLPSHSFLPVAFAHIRFEWEADEAVCYLYEIQVDRSYQKKGIGLYLMQIIELFTVKFQLSKIMLTVFKFNTAAQQFYREKLNFELDESDPNDERLEQYEILSKKNKRKVIASKEHNFSNNNGEVNSAADSQQQGATESKET
jgi:ribosomal protein S18 acetylase RimI-like enzyme